MSRDALVIGINTYDRLSKLRSPATDAEAIAQLLTHTGNFRVRRLPEVVLQDGSLSVGRTTKVTLPQLEEALVQLFKPEGQHSPDTALLFFSGHGLRKDRGIQEGFLATSDTDPDAGFYGLSLQWLRRLLQESPVRQQIVWLDCCHSGELLNFDQADPGDRGRGRDRCFIAASRDYEVAYEETAGQHGVLTGALLQALDPRQRPDGMVTNFSLTEAVEQTLRTATQRPLFANSGHKIILTGKPVETRIATSDEICPYKGLAYFDCNDDDPKYFHGRTALTDALLEKVREGNFLAVVGASGSGKSSVVRAGLIHQLKLGQRLSGSDRWQIHIFRPGMHPLQSLSEAFVNPQLSGIDRADQLRKAEELIHTGAVGLNQLVRAASGDRVVLVIDQFEECFTLCRDEVERQQFFECVFGALEAEEANGGEQRTVPHELRSPPSLNKASPSALCPLPSALSYSEGEKPPKLCVVITLRADFFGKCLEQDYAGLARWVQQHLVAVTPMNRDELEQAIAEPAKQVGLEVEAELIDQMITDVEGAPASLPLLQYTLRELWLRRSVNWLTFAAYNQLGGVRGTLQQRAEAVYAMLSTAEQEIAKQIFLELTQLGEGTEDTRRQVPKRELVSSSQTSNLVDTVLQKLSAERLIVTTELVAKSSNAGRLEVVDIAHEALIRHWSRLRRWINDNRLALRQKRDVEEAAEAWLEKDKPTELAYLLQGSKLLEAEDFINRHRTNLPLSSLAQEFIQVSQTERDRQLRQERQRKHWRIGMAIAFPTLIAVAALLLALQKQQSQKTIEAVFLDTDTAETLSNLPGSLEQANVYRKQVDQLNGGNDEEAIAYYTQHQPELNRAFAYYRQILRVVGRAQRQIQQNPDEFAKTLQSGETLEATTQTINTILQHAENSLAALIIKYRLPQLKQYLLAQPRPTVGEILPNTVKGDFENQYTEGALRTTYEILMGPSGAGADLNGDGLIRDAQEANQLPCEVLRQIEGLWRQISDNQCSWYTADSDDYDPDCTLLESDRSTLVSAIFDFPTDFVTERLSQCGIAASPTSVSLQPNTLPPLQF
jgi:energy-coupling factor transporter ATP-binding protein EcfA2